GPAPAAQAALALGRAHSPGLVCSMDPAPGHLIAEYGPARFRDLLAALRFDVLLPNLEEGQLITGATDPAAVATGLRALAPVVALKLGAAGCLVAWGGEQRQVPAVPAVVVDATGAGDAFAAGFLASYLAARDPLAAAQAGAQSAAAIVARRGPR